MSYRPRPPNEVLQAGHGAFVPAPELVAWIEETFIDHMGPLVNPDHAHIRSAVIGALWTNEPCRSKQAYVAASAEVPMPRGRLWIKARQEFQLLEWFGSIPDFVLTFFAPYAAEVDHATFCALVEHELYHCAQATDEFGSPKFRRSDGGPVFAIKGHDVEEFVGVVRRYGPGPAAGQTRALVEAARGRPEVTEAQLATVCGTCLGVAA